MLWSIISANPIYALPWIIAITLAIAVHEYCHALAAYLQGDDTAERLGRLTLNPLVHIDVMGFILLLLVGFGWGKPTPFNPYNLKYKKWGSSLVSIAGPLSNIVMAIAAILVYKLISGGDIVAWSQSTNLLDVFLQFMVYINVILFVFNLIPIPPLDGSKILYTILGPKHQNIVVTMERYGTYLLIGLILLAQPLLSFLINIVLTGLYTIFGL